MAALALIVGDVVGGDHVRTRCAGICRARLRRDDPGGSWVWDDEQSWGDLHWHWGDPSRAAELSRYAADYKRHIAEWVRQTMAAQRGRGAAR